MSAESANTFSSMQPDLKESYASKMQKIMNKPNSSKQYFAHIKKYLKKAKKNNK